MLPVFGESTLDSHVTIRIQSAFNPLAPMFSEAQVLRILFCDFGGVGLFPGSEFPEHAISRRSPINARESKCTLHRVFPDIIATFSSNFNFYLGLDNNHGPLNDLVAVLLHEFGHGLNFANKRQ